MRDQILILTVTIPMLLAGCDHQSSSTATKYLALGDSYTIGESVDPSDRFPVQLANQLRKQNIDLGEPQIIARTGWRTDQLIAAIEAEKPKGPFQLVTLLIGVNNQFQNQSIEQFRSEFTDLLNRSILLAGGKPEHVIVFSIPDWGVTPFARGRDLAQIALEIDQFNAVCREEATKRAVPFIDITPISRKVTSDPSLVAIDDLHPSGKMYQAWVEAALPAIRR